MPRSIEDLKVLSKQYLKNIQGDESTNEEKVYLSYIEEHYLAACKKEAESQEQHKRGSSPIREL